MKRYKYLIFDADHTIIDFEADERAAFRRLFAGYGVDADDEMLSRSRELSVKTWNEVGLSDVHDEKIQRAFHDLYRSHLSILFSRIFREYPIFAAAHADPESAGAKFLKLLEYGGAQMRGAEKILASLSEAGGGKYKICVATNGLHGIQTGRLSGLERYFYRIYISEDIGVIKPLSAFFARILEELPADGTECLMIGDSLESDVAGAKGAGIDSCWLNVEGRENKTSARPDYEIRALEELLFFL